MPDQPKVDPVLDKKIGGAIHEAKLIPSIDPQAPMPSTTTAEEDKKTAGQRSTNLIWETTQATIAIIITGAVIYSALAGIKSEILNTAFVLVISMYLVRTNHTKVGGIGGTDSR